MTQFQRVIRDLANILAVFLVVMIFTGIAGAALLVSGGISLKNHIDEKWETDFSEVYEGVSEVEIEVSSASVQIVQGEEFKVEANDKALNIKQRGNELKITESGSPLSHIFDAKIVLYIPSDVTLQKFELVSGAGTVNIKKIVADKLKLEVGAGEAYADYLEAVTSADIEVGAGKISVSDASLSNLSFEVGVGEGNLKGKLNGRSEIDVGIGELVLSVTLSISEYTVKAETGIGDFVIEDEKITGDRTIGEGANVIEVNGGIGSIVVDFE